MIVSYNDKDITVTQESDRTKLELDGVVGYVYGREPNDSDYDLLIYATDAELVAEEEALLDD